MTGPYRVEVDDHGCGECQSGMTWHVVGPDDLAFSTSYDDEGDADSLRDALNSAYLLGQNSVTPTAVVPWKPFLADMNMPDYTSLIAWDAQYKRPTNVFYTKSSHSPEELERLQYTHYLTEEDLQPPPVAAAPDVPVIEPPPESPPNSAPTPEIKDWDDDIPF